MKLTRRQLRRMITEELANVVFDDIHEVPDDLEFLDPHEAYGLGHAAGMEHAEEEELDDASDVVPREDAWPGGDNLDTPRDYARLDTGESNAGPHVTIREEA